MKKIFKPSLKAFYALVGFFALTVLFLIGIRTAERKLTADFVDNSVAEIVQVARNIVLRLKRESSGDIVHLLLSDSSVRKIVEERLSILLSKYVKAVYIVYRDKEGRFRLVASATSEQNKSVAGQTVMFYSAAWIRAYRSDREINVFHRHFRSVAITSLIPISAGSGRKVMIVVDFSRLKVLKSEKLIEFYRTVVIVISVLTVLIIVLYALNFLGYLRFRRMAMRDALTGVFSRAALDEILSFINLSDYAVSVVDVDHFKRINDTYGHDVGDVVLKSIADTMKQQVRLGSDYIVRLGGEEFLLLIRKKRCGDSCEYAVNVLERIKRSIENLRIDVNGESISVTVSIGIFTKTEKIRNIEGAIKKADRCLYKAKNNGRNRLEVWLSD